MSSIFGRMGGGSNLSGFNSNNRLSPVPTRPGGPTVGTPSTGTSAGTLDELANDIPVPNGPDDSVSDLSFSPQAEFLSVASWDKKNRIYEINTSTGQVEGRALFEHDGPVLSTRWSLDGTKVISGGADKQVKLFDLTSQQTQTIGIHNEAVKAVRYVACGPTNTQCVVSGSWDKTLKYWDMRQQNPIATLQMPERVYAMDSKSKLLVVGTAERHLLIINLDQPDKIFKQMMSPLKFQTRSIACAPKADCFAIGSIEGRCGIQYIDDAQQRDLGFSFKCQREQKATTKQTLVYSVNTIDFHPVYGTFLTSGSDGTFSFWDKDGRHRLKGYPSMNATIPVMSFNRNGSILAYALSYDWSKGHEYNRQDYPNLIKLHPIREEEVKPRPPVRKPGGR